MNKEKNFIREIEVREIEVAANTYEKERDYWLTKLSGELVKSHVYYDRKNNLAEEYHMDEVTLEISPDMYRNLNKLSSGSHHKLHMILTAGLVLMLYKYTGNNDIIIGAPIYKQEIEGEFVNTVLALRNTVADAMTFKELLLSVRQTFFDAVENQNYPIESLVFQLKLPMEDNEFPLFDVVILLENIHDQNYLQHVHPRMYFIFAEVPGGIEGTIEYHPGYYERSTLEQVGDHYLSLLRQALSDVNRRFSELDVLSMAEKNWLVNTFNRTAVSWPNNKTVTQLFEEQVEKYPGKTSVVFENETLTYRELDEKANRIANYLYLEKQIRADHRIGLLMDKSCDCIAAILGILKAGGGYVPIDPVLPGERIAEIIEDADIEVLISEKKYITTLNHLQWQWSRLHTYLCVDSQALEKYPCLKPSVQVDPHHLLYIIYTSGTTGKPKGVMIEHQNIVRLMVNDCNLFDFNDHDVWTMFHAYNFDFSVWEMYGALLHGGKLIIISRETARDTRKYLELLEEHGVTVLNQTPAAFYRLMEEEADADRTGIQLKLRYLIFGGEALIPAKLKNWREKYPHTKIINMYGITETTVHVTYKDIGLAEIENDSRSIGSPIPTLNAMVLDYKAQLLPVGAPGELHVGGAGVARGYLNRPELTAEKFNSNRSYRTNRTYVFYKTGDLARVLNTGELEYLGRIDYQVKIRGFRIELGEIESHIRRHDAVKDVAVIVRNDDYGDRYLCAYIAWEKNNDISKLKEYLAKKLPDYMIPLYFVPVEKIPLTPNGKLDLKTLPKPGTAESGDDFSAPRDEIEVKMAEIWADILRIDKGKISMTANFFELGGHSLKATILIVNIHKVFNVKIPLAVIFKTPTIRELAAYMERMARDIHVSIEPAEEREYYVLSSAQKRIYFLQQFDLTGIGYNIPLVLSFGKRIEKDKLELVIRRLIDRHESLRTSFEMVNRQVVQKIHKAGSIEFSLDYYEADKTGARKLINDYIKPFDLSRAPLFRSGLIALPDGNCIWIVDMHHIISDGTSHTILTEDFTAEYSSKKLKPLQIQYKDFALWQQRRFETGEIKAQMEYWLDLLAGEIPHLNLPVDYKRPPAFTFEGDSYKFILAGEEAKKFKGLGSQGGGTLYMNMLAVLNVLFYKYTGQSDIIIGSGIGGRRHADLQGVVGMFINALAMRNYPKGEKTYESFLKEVITGSVRGFENQDVQFEDLVDNLDLERDASRNPVFDIMMMVQNYRRAGESDGSSKIEYADMPAMDKSLVANENPATSEYKISTSKFDMTFLVHEQGDDIFVYIEYYTSVFKPGTIHRLTFHLKNIINAIVTDSFIKLKDIEIMSNDEKKKLIYEFNNTERNYPRDKAIFQLFHGQALRTPDHIALVVTEREGKKRRREEEKDSCVETLRATSLPEPPIQITYRELNEQSNRLAGLLIAKSVLPDTIVGIMMERSIEMIIGILGILKSGGAYMPIDPSYPQERIDYMLKDSGAKILIRRAEERKSGRAEKERGVFITFFLASPLPRFLASDSSSLAYIMYTSGSTGKPKGVMVEHRSVVRLVINNDFIEFSDRLRVLQTGAPVFDAVTFEMWGPLLNGGRLYLVENEVILDPGKLGQALQKYQINTMWLTASLCNQLVGRDSQENSIFSTLEWLVVGGDVLSPSPIAEIRHKNHNLTVVNGYGPTENTTFSVCHRIDRDYENSIPIGKPIANSCAYILDKDGHLQPLGVPGELYVGGDGLSRGYLNNPELTAERFKKYRSYRTNKTYICYRTGDLARWLNDGTIEFLGRIDQQVKIRGFRVELGEIESRLLNHPMVKEAVVIVKEDGKRDKSICAYVVSTGKNEILKLREYLAKEFPNYMIPAYFIQLEKLPLTINGKVDRKALPAPQVGTSDIYVAPINEIESQIVEIWAEVLGIKKEHIGVNDDFFHLGGHSLNATLLALQIEKVFNLKFSLTDVFSCPTVREMTPVILEAREKIYREIKPIEKREYYPQSSAQKRLFFLEQLENIGTTYNISSILKVEGKLDFEQFHQAILKVIRRHETLRTSFKIIANEPIQIVHDHVDFEIEKYTGSQIDDMIRDFIRPFDLSQAPLFRVGLISLPGEGYLLLYDLHHIIGDGTSMGILIDDFVTFYDGKELPSITVQYKDFTAWQNHMIETQEIAKQEEYWLSVFQKEIPKLNFPTDYPRPENLTFKGDWYLFKLVGEEAGAIHSFAVENKATLFMILLAAFNALLYKYSGQNDIIVGTGIMGRPHTDLQHSIGMFVNSLAIRNYPSGEMTFLQFLSEVRENCICAFANQDVQFEELVDKLKLQRDNSRNPLFDVLLIVQNFEQAKFVDVINVKFSPYHHENKTSKFDLNLAVWEIGSDIHFRMEYSTALFKPETIIEIMANYIGILKQVVKKRDILIDNLSVSNDLVEAKLNISQKDKSQFTF